MIGALLLLAALQAPDAAAAAPSPAPSTSPGAPADDYGYVAWCRGALQGHMDLYKQAAPDMVRVRQDKLAVEVKGKSAAEAAKIRAKFAKETDHEAELDAQQLAAGKDYMALYGRALATAEEAGAPRARGAELTGQGYRIWSAARAADGKTRMYSYLMWELPGRCETAAKALEERSGLLAEAFRRPDAPSPPPADAAPAAASPPELRPAAPAPGA